MKTFTKGQLVRVVAYPTHSIVIDDDVDFFIVGKVGEVQGEMGGYVLVSFENSIPLYLKSPEVELVQSHEVSPTVAELGYN